MNKLCTLLSDCLSKILVYAVFAVASMAPVYAQLEIKTADGESSPLKFCAFALLSVDLEAYNISQEDSCIWTFESENAYDEKLVYFEMDKSKPVGNTKVTLFLKDDLVAKGGDIVVTVTEKNTKKTAAFTIELLQRANQPGEIKFVRPFCDNMVNEFTVPQDKTDYGYPISYSWAIFKEGETQMPIAFGNQDDTLFRLFLNNERKEYVNARLEITPLTCDATSASTYYKKAPNRSVVIQPFVRRDLYENDPALKALRFTSRSVADKEPEWEPVDDLSACTFYSTAFNGNSRNVMGEAMAYDYEVEGYGDGYLYLQVGNYPLSELETEHYAFEWLYDPSQLEMVEDKMNMNAYLKDNGFGKDKSRVAFKVLHDQGGTKNIKVRVKITCKECMDRPNAGAQDFEKEVSQTFLKVDSIQPYDDYTVSSPLEICSQKDAEFVFLQGDPENYVNSNATGFFFYEDQSRWNFVKELEAPKMGFVLNFNAPPVTSLGDSVNVRVYPKNTCFRNLQSVGQNGRNVKVFVKKSPLMPVMVDPVLKEVHAPLSLEQWKAGNKPQTSLLLCNYNRELGRQKFIFVNANDVISEYKLNEEYGTLKLSENYIQWNKISNDSLEMTIEIKEGNRENFENQSVDLGVKAVNGCGEGEEGIFTIRIIDTLNVYSPIEQADGVMMDTVCEGSLLNLRTDDGNYKTMPSNERNTDVIRYLWEKPNGWAFNTKTDSIKSETGVILGQQNGVVAVKLGNKCGWSQKRYSDTIRINPYTRVQIRGNASPCEGSTAEYRIDTVFGVDMYQWKVPDGWEILDGDSPTIDTARNQDAAENQKGYLSIQVKAGSKPGNIYVVGAKEKCNFGFDNYKELHRRDSLTVAPKNFTGKPQPKEKWDDTLCSHSTVRLEVEPHPDDVGSSIYFTWIFSSEEWEKEAVLSKDGSVLEVKVPQGLAKRDRIRVVSNSSDCGESNRGDTLTYDFVIMDTVAVAGGLLDMYAPEQVLSTAPCEGDTLCISLDFDMQDMSVLYYNFKFNGAQNVTGDNLLDDSGWQILDKESRRFRDTLRLVVGSKEAEVSVCVVNTCGESSYITSTLTPKRRVTDAVQFINAKQKICNGEEVVFTYQPVEHATHYVWHYPWGKMTDTITEEESAAMGNAREFSSKTYQKGDVYVYSYNACGLGPRSEVISITQIISAPKKPGLDDFAGSYDPLLTDTATIKSCLRQPLELKASYSDPAEPSETYAFDWFYLQGEEAEVEESVSGSQNENCSLTKKQGLEEVLWGVRAKNTYCQNYGDTLYLKIQYGDTLSLPKELLISDVIMDERTGVKVQPRPCGNDTMMLYLKKWDQQIDSVFFVWNEGQEYASDSTMDGTDNKLFDIQKFEKLHFRVSNTGQSLNIRPIVRNECGLSKLPALKIQSSTKLTTTISIAMLSETVCNEEEIVIRVDSLEAAGNYIWHFPWGNQSDTTVQATRKFKADYKAGVIYAYPNNGCGLGPKSEELVLSGDSIVYPPSMLQPLNFASSYKPGEPVAIDTLCMNAPVVLAVGPTQSSDRLTDIGWSLKQGNRAGFRPNQVQDSLCEVEQYNLRDTAFVLYVAAKNPRCQTYGDSLEIRLYPMDTIEIGNIDTALSFYANRNRLIWDQLTGQPIHPTPCRESEVKYYLPSPESVNWSVDSVWMKWSGGADWSVLDSTLLPEMLYMKVGVLHPLNFEVSLRNRCGITHVPSIQVTPKQIIKEKARFQDLALPLCEHENLVLKAFSVPAADSYVWTTPWGKDTTDLPQITYPDTLPFRDGEATVYAFNNCGVSAVSDPVQLKFMGAPKILQPVWWPTLQVKKDTVTDSICLHSTLNLQVGRNPKDTVWKDYEMKFYWEKISGGVVAVDDGNKNDAECLVRPGRADKAGDVSLFRVFAQWQDCQGMGDTLYIRLKVVDTIPVSLLGSILPMGSDAAVVGGTGEFNLEPCPREEICMRVENDIAPAYQWILPSGWQFKDPETQHQGEICVIAGSQSGVVSVYPIPDADDRFCNYGPPARVLQTPQFNPLPTLTTQPFQTYVTHPCVGSVASYSVQPTEGAEAYQWIYPSTWKGPVTSDYVQVNDSTIEGSRALSFLVSKDSGYVKVYAMSNCAGRLVPGTEVKQMVEPVDTAQVTVFAPNKNCKDSTLVVQVEKNAYTRHYDLEVVYKGPDQTPVEITFPGKVDGKTDSSFFEVVCANLDTVFLIFKPVSIQCPDLIKVDTHFILVDTVPVITGRIFGPDEVCNEGIYWFTAKADMDTVAGRVNYRWRLPADTTWKALSRLDSSSICVQIGNYGQFPSIDSLYCYPMALCGTADPFIKTLSIVEPPAFNNSIVAVNPELLFSCVNAELHFQLENMDYDPDSVSFFWEYPAGWTDIYGVDSLPRAAFQTGFDGILETGVDSVQVKVRYLKVSTCGLSQPLSIDVYVQDTARRVGLSRGAYQCMTNDVYELIVEDLAWIDSVRWEPLGNLQSEDMAWYTQGNIKNDSLLIQNNGYDTPFEIRVHSYNVCGSRDSVLLITPVGDLPPFGEQLQQNHYCNSDDTVYAFVKCPYEHFPFGVTYDWSVGSSWNKIKDFLDIEDSTAVAAFRPNTTDTAAIQVIARSVCAVLDTLDIVVRPFKYQVFASAGQNTAVYMEDEIALNWDSVSRGVFADYDVRWLPENRIKERNGQYMTREMVSETEHFYMQVKEKEVEQPENIYQQKNYCTAGDTVRIKVDSLFTLKLNSRDVRCRGAQDEELVTEVTGGNRNSYQVQWYRKEGFDYQPIPEATGLTLTLDVEEEVTYLMLVGSDTTLLYKDAETQDTLLHTAIHTDTLYVELKGMDLLVGFNSPGEGEIKVPVGTKLYMQLKVLKGSGCYTVDWTPQELFFESDMDKFNDFYTRPVYGDAQIKAVVYDTISHCESEAVVEVMIKEEFSDDIPNTFTPNGDGINDIFMPGVDLEIFNRLGERLFKSTEKEGWDGTYKGKRVDVGDYLYIITMNKAGKNIYKKGVVTVFWK